MADEFGYPPPRSDTPETVRFAITLSPRGGAPGLSKLASAPQAGGLGVYRIDAERAAGLRDRLAKLGIEVRGQGRFALTACCSRAQFEKLFQTRLDLFNCSPLHAPHTQAGRFYFPNQGAPWTTPEALGSDFDDAYIQWPHQYFNSMFAPGPSGLPPDATDHHLRVPSDVAMLLNAARVHRVGFTGRGVRVAMIDTGFAHDHPHFQRHGYDTDVTLAPGADFKDRDGHGHGTAESANLLAIAPDVEFHGVKLENEDNPDQSATLLEGFQAAVDLKPQVISVSLGYDLVVTDPASGMRISDGHLTRLPNSLRALETEIRLAVANGIAVVFSAGNGQVAFPGMMPEVISAGGVHIDRSGTMRASDYASAFTSQVYSDRHVPDFSGLVGLAANNARYIMLPVESSAEIDHLEDGTRTHDGWTVISGTSAAAPQIAGVCALLLQRDSNLSPDDMKELLAKSANKVVLGAANPASNGDRGGVPADATPGATGHGLVDAFEALRLVSS